ncbi:MAG: dTMP kinase [Alphaproteobacteria bacterium]|nr:dTMP kinase [Alphaproteobacteria bacterium]
MLAGRFITLEGGEGCGKSTQSRLLAEWLRTKHIDVVQTREPGGTPGAEAIRALLLQGEAQKWDGVTEVLLFTAARRDHVEKVIKPAMARGAWVVCDRFADSTMAYQGYGHRLDRHIVTTLYTTAIGGFAPDLTLVLDIDVATGLDRARRVTGRDQDRFENMDMGFHERLREGFLTIAKAEPERCAVVDARGAVDEVQAQLRKTISERLQVR